MSMSRTDALPRVGQLHAIGELTRVHGDEFGDVLSAEHDVTGGGDREHVERGAGIDGKDDENLV